MTDDRNPNYQTELRFRVAAFYDEFIQAIQTPGEDTLALMQGFVREVALDSFKNGKEAGAQRPQSSYRGRRMRIVPIGIQGTALANGKLKPVAQ